LVAPAVGTSTTPKGFCVDPAAWTTVNVCPPTVIVPVRVVSALGFA
jgi:hypothetical protein